MFKDVKNIHIKGGCYNDGVDLDGILSQWLNIVYGRNGSGKSSLATAIYDFAHGTANPRFDISFEPELSADARSRIFVYGEDFVINNVKLADDGLEQIVMIGEQVGLSDREDGLKEEKKTISKQLSDKNASLEDYKTKKNTAEKNLLAALKGDYATREKEFRRLNRNPNITLETIGTIYQKKPSGTTYAISTLLQEISNGTKVVLGATDAQKITWSVPVLTMPDTIEKANTLLTKKVQQVELDERDRYLMSILSNPSLSHYVDDARRDLIDANAKICPLCQQPLDSHSIHDLEEQIKRVLNKDVESYKNELRNVTDSITDLSCTIPSFTVDTYNADISPYKDKVANVNQALDSLRNRLRAKSTNLFNSEQPFDLETVRQLYADVEDARKKLQADVDAFNKSIDDRKKLENDLKEKNQILAYLENQVLFDNYYDAAGKITQAKKEFEDLNHRLIEINSELSEIESQRNQTKIAVDFINKSLSYIFFDNTRLTLEDNGGKFKLKSRGKAVPPNSISTGERNIIGLAYFFALLFQNTSSSNRYDNPYLVVIDDPITSFDQDNRLGVMSFLKENLTDLIVKCDDCKVLVMSHDQRTIDLFVNINRNINNHLPYNKRTSQADSYVYELHKRSMRDTSSNTSTDNEYSQMIRLLYRFAQDQEPDKIEYVGIGNTIRRVLETFSMMMFNSADYVRMVDSKYLRLNIPRNCDMETVRNAYRRMLTRIVLNPESHSSTQIDQNSYESTFSRESMQKLARITLTFIMCVNDQHLFSSLGNGYSYIVNKWFNELVSGK